ncbi:MAG: hypothetical protein IPG76_09740 [Acidobacteria bacterium]|nr:hypothetical protein [Acidobacteriota bacterium]
MTCLDAAKEVVERLRGAERLEALTVDGGNVRADGFDAGKLRRLGIVVERDVIDLIGVRRS